MKKQLTGRQEAAPPALRATRDDEIQDPRSLHPSFPPSLPVRGMFDFRYTCTEVFAEDGDMQVRVKQVRYQDGRLRNEECEGRLDARAAERMVIEAQQQFLSQAAGVARLLLAPFLPRGGRRD